MSEWIKFSDRTPDKPQWILFVYLCNNVPCTSPMFWDHRDPVSHWTHWMPLNMPEPPKEPTQADTDIAWACDGARKHYNSDNCRSAYEHGANHAFMRRDEQVREIMKGGLWGVTGEDTVQMSRKTYNQFCRLVGYNQCK